MRFNVMFFRNSFFVIFLLNANQVRAQHMASFFARTDSLNGARIYFPLGNKQDLGEVPAGQDAICSFRIRNAGNSPLLIQSVVGDSGNMSAEWPMEPIPPGQAATITTTLRTSDRTAPFAFSKMYRISSNAPGEQVLQISGRRGIGK